MIDQRSKTTPLGELVKEHGFNRTARESGVADAHLWRILNNRRNPIHETRQKLADALGVAVEDVLWPAEERAQLTL